VCVEDWRGDGEWWWEVNWGLWGIVSGNRGNGTGGRTLGGSSPPSVTAAFVNENKLG
jgi:hypothetical protein